MKLKRNKINVVVSGLNDASFVIKYSVNASVSNQDKSYVKNLDFLVVPKITADLTPARKIDVSIQNFNNFKLLDKSFYVPE